MSAAAILGGLGSGLEIYGKIKASKDEASALQAEAAIAGQNAQAAILKAKAEAEVQVIQSKYIMGTQKADFASAGVEGGSVAAVMANSATNAELDRLNILFGGDVTAHGFQSEQQQKLKSASDVTSAGMYDALASGLQLATMAAMYA